MAISLKTEGRSGTCCTGMMTPASWLLRRRKREADGHRRGQALHGGGLSGGMGEGCRFVKPGAPVPRRNLPWHDRLTKNRAGLNVVRTLMDMVRRRKCRRDRGGCARPHRSGLASAGGPASFWGVEFVEVAALCERRERYEAQIAELEASATPWAVIESMNDAINAKFMHAAVLVTGRMLPIAAQVAGESEFLIFEELRRR